MGRFLPEAVQSVLAQTYTEWELIIVDDGSRPDEFAVALAQINRQPERIRVFAGGAEATGSSATRNRGIQEARGEYLALLDADDIWLPEKLAHQVDLMDSSREVAMTFAPVRYFLEGEGEEKEYDQPFAPLQPGMYFPPKVLPIFIRHPEVYPCPTATLIRMKAIRMVGGFEERFRKIRTDLAAWTKLSSRYPVFADDVIVARYRQHAGSAVAESKRLGMAFAYDRAYFHWALQYIENLPAGVRSELEPILCEKMLYYAVQDALSRGIRSSLGWRIDVGSRLIRYRAFWRDFRWIRALLLKATTFGG